MKIALNGATTMHADLVTDIRIAGAAGYDLVEIWAAKLRTYLESNSVADLRALLAENSLRAHSINSIEHITFRNETDYEAIKQECDELSAIAGEIGCPYVVVVPGKLPPGASQDSIKDHSIEVLTELAEIASRHGVGLAFEFLGQTDCSVQTLDFCAEIVDEIDREDVGLVVDSFHFYAGNSSFESFGKIPAEKLFIFHINDAEDLPKEELTDAHRLFPGEGILPLARMREELSGIGFNGVVSIEIFRPEYWNMDPSVVAVKSIESTRRVMFGENRTVSA